MKRNLLLLLTFAPLFFFGQTSTPLQLDKLRNFYADYFLRVTNRKELSNGDRLLTFIPSNNQDVTNGTPNDTATYPPPFTPSEEHELHVLYDNQYNIKARLWTIGGISVINDTIYAIQRIEVVDSIDIDPNGNGLYVTPTGSPLIATKYNQDLVLISHRQVEMGTFKYKWQYVDGLDAFVVCTEVGYPTAHVNVRQLDKNFTLLDSHYVGFSTATNNYPPMLRDFFPAAGGGFYASYRVNGVGGTYNFDLSGNTSTGTAVSFQRLVLVKYDANLSPLWITQIADSYTSFFLVYTLEFYQDAQGRLLGNIYNTDPTHYFQYANGMDSVTISSSQGGKLLYEFDASNGEIINTPVRSQSFQLRGEVTTSTVSNGVARVINTRYTTSTDSIYFDPFQKTNAIPNQELGVVVYSDVFSGTVDTYFSLPTTVGRDSLFVWDVNQRPDGRLELVINSIGSSIQPDPSVSQTIDNYPGLSVKALTVWSAANLVNQEPGFSELIELSLYPNPTDHYLNINSTLDVMGTELIDMQGRILLQSSASVTTLDVSEVPAGVYLLRMTLEHGVIATKRVIIER